MFHNKTYNEQHMKKSLMQFADNVGPDQPAHKRRLIRTFIVRLQNSMNTVVYVDEECSDKTAQMRILIWIYIVRKFYKGLFVRCASHNNLPCHKKTCLRVCRNSKGQGPVVRN